jgi:hypothetical protein
LPLGIQAGDGLAQLGQRTLGCTATVALDGKTVYFGL